MKLNSIVDENTTIEKTYKFLKEYEKLCQKYDLSIKGCGCCGSPYIEYEDYKYIEDINYNNDLKRIEIGNRYDKKTLDEYFKKNI